MLPSTFFSVFFLSPFPSLPFPRILSLPHSQPPTLQRSRYGTVVAPPVIVTDCSSCSLALLSPHPPSFLLSLHSSCSSPCRIGPDNPEFPRDLHSISYKAFAREFCSTNTNEGVKFFRWQLPYIVSSASLFLPSLSFPRSTSHPHRSPHPFHLFSTRNPLPAPFTYPTHQ